MNSTSSNVSYAVVCDLSEVKLLTRVWVVLLYSSTHVYAPQNAKHASATMNLFKANEVDKPSGPSPTQPNNNECNQKNKTNIVVSKLAPGGRVRVSVYSGPL